MVASASKKESRNLEFNYLKEEKSKMKEVAATLESQRIDEEKQLEASRIEMLKAQQSVIKVMIAGWKHELEIKAAEISETEKQIQVARDKEQIEIQKVILLFTDV
jgi:hypothetical protein